MKKSYKIKRMHHSKGYIQPHVYVTIAAVVFVIGILASITARYSWYHEIGHLVFSYLTFGGGTFVAHNMVSVQYGIFHGIVTVGAGLGTGVLGLLVLIALYYRFPWPGWFFWGVGHIEVFKYTGGREFEGYTNQTLYVIAGILIFLGGWFLIARMFRRRLLNPIKLV